MKNNSKSKKRLDNYRKIIRTRKNNKVGKRRTMKGGATKVATPLAQLSPQSGPLAQLSPQSGPSPALSDEKITTNLIKGVKGVVDAVAADAAAKAAEGRAEFKKLHDLAQIAQAEADAAAATAKAAEGRAEFKKLHDLAQIAQAEADAAAAEEAQYNSIVGQMPLDKSPILTPIPDGVLESIEDEAEKGIFLVNEELDKPGRFKFAVSCFRNFKEYGCPYTELKFEKNSTPSLINKISNYADCFDTVETLDLSQTTITKLPMNFSKMISLKYVYLPKTITSHSFYDFAVKAPALRIIDVPGFYERVEIPMKDKAAAAKAVDHAAEQEKTRADKLAKQKLISKPEFKTEFKTEIEEYLKGTRSDLGVFETTYKEFFTTSELKELIFLKDVGDLKNNALHEQREYLKQLINLVNLDEKGDFSSILRKLIYPSHNDLTKEVTPEEVTKLKDILLKKPEFLKSYFKLDSNNDLQEIHNKLSELINENNSSSKLIEEKVALSPRDILSNKLLQIHIVEFELEIGKTEETKTKIIAYEGIPSLLFELREPVEEENDDKVEDIIKIIFVSEAQKRFSLKNETAYNNTIFIEDNPIELELNEDYKHLLLFPNCLNPSLLINLSNNSIKPHNN